MAFKLCPKCFQRKHAAPAKKKRSKSYGRTKGLAFERWVAVKLRKVFPAAERQLEFQVSSALGTDLKNTGDLRIQCKAFKDYAPISCIREVQICPIEGGVPVLVTKGDKERPVAVMYFEDFIELVQHAKRGQRRSESACAWGFE